MTNSTSSTTDENGCFNIPGTIFKDGTCYHPTGEPYSPQTASTSDEISSSEQSYSTRTQEEYDAQQAEASSSSSEYLSETEAVILTTFYLQLQGLYNYIQEWNKYTANDIMPVMMTHNLPQDEYAGIKQIKIDELIQTIPADTMGIDYLYKMKQGPETAFHEEILYHQSVLEGLYTSINASADQCIEIFKSRGFSPSSTGDEPVEGSG